jgi:hypothetical protein
MADLNVADFTYILTLGSDGQVSGGWVPPRPFIGVVKVGNVAHFKGVGGDIHIEFKGVSPFTTAQGPLLVHESENQGILELDAKRDSPVLHFACAIKASDGKLIFKQPDGDDFPVDKGT